MLVDKVADGAGGEHHHRHDALAVDHALWLAADANLAREAGGYANELGRGTGVQAQLVDDGDLAGRHRNSLKVAVANLYVLQLILEHLAQALGQVDRAVMAAGAADGDC